MLDIFDMFKKIKIDLNKLQFRWRKTNLFSLEKCLSPAASFMWIDNFQKQGENQNTFA